MRRASASILAATAGAGQFSVRHAELRAGTHTDFTRFVYLYSLSHTSTNIARPGFSRLVTGFPRGACVSRAAADDHTLIFII